MNVTKLNYKMDKFDEKNVELILKDLGFNTDNYFMAMTRPSLLNQALIGKLAQFSNRYCIISFSETELNLVMLSRVNNKVVTELINIDNNEINNIKLSDVLISYMLKINTNKSTIKLQVYKKFGKFTKVRNSIELFKKIYNL